MCFALRAGAGRMLGIRRAAAHRRGRVLARVELAQLSMGALEKLGQAVSPSSQGLYQGRRNLLEACA
jgi:hypothetical protein